MSEPESEPEPLLQAQSPHNESAAPRELLSTDDGKVEVQPKPRVDLGYAQYDGRYLSNGVNQFKGMRYAAPPLGDLRWRAPRALSVREPGTPMLLPVWVYIQGGGYTANSNPDYIGATVVEESGMNVILVNFNYRVGLWGFLAGEQVREDGDLNVGLLDQRQLLKWVKTHIAKFGGDPDRVIIHGVSAGAGSAALHLTAFGGRDDGLFSGVMTQSVFFPAHQKLRDLQYQFNKTLELAGCSPDHEPMSCLRAKTSRELQTVVNRALAFPGEPRPRAGIGPLASTAT
ncbi:unnamed protein product [Parascedosporium putredinis]|uniref:Carboxylic ester hydrolase n=1 Tax=Parascedosporium putredinis TaxID=1442378 RepID=A0A9P1H5T6_9PEZI|nr:unnamed protein product [Parascedosporium putredinis]CAI7998066.1 unnamed protein product [Parascedosporium putredinis]